MVRKTIISVSVAGLLAVALPWEAYSLGLGEIKLNSALNQPLRAEIRLHAVHETPLEDIQVSLASREEFSRAGVEPALGLSDLRFRAERKENGETVVEVTSQGSVRDPFLEFLVTISWPQGHLSRAYTILLDPPSSPLDTGPSLGATRAVSSRSPSVPSLQKKGETAKMALAPPSGQDGAVTSSAADMAPATYGPTTPTDTLWPLAQRLRPKPSILPQQMMLALQRANPEAFLHNNLNGLIVGRVLNVPPEEEVLSISLEEAVQHVRQQNEAWTALLEKKGSVEDQPQAAKTSDQKAETLLGDKTAEENEALVASSQIHSPETVPAGKTSDSKFPDLEHLLTLVQEALEVRTQENKALQNRLRDLEQEVGTLQQRSSLVPSPERLAPAAKGREEGVLDRQGLVPPSREETLNMATKEVNTSAGSAEVSPSPLQSVLGTLIALKNPLLLGGVGILLLSLVALQVRKRKAREAPMLLRVAGPAREIVGVPPEVLNVIPIALQSETSKVEAVKVIDEPLSFLGKKAKNADSLEDTLLRSEAQASASPEDTVESSFAGGEVAAAAQKPEEAEAVELDLGKITSSDRNTFTEEGSVEFEELSYGGESVLEFDLSEFSLEESPAEIERPEEAETSELEFDRGAVASFSRSDSREGEAREASAAFTAKEAPLNTEKFATEAVDSANPDTAAEGCRPQIESSGQELMDDLDEMEIKIDLAQAYMEMDRPQEARDILEEVVIAGDQRQRGVSQDLLTKLPKAS